MNSVGIGTRVLAFIPDSLLILLLTFAAYRTWEWYSFYYGVVYFPFYYFWAAVAFLYYLIFEGIWKRTPGKWLSLTKVVNAAGKRPSFSQIIVRSLVRVIGFILIDSLFLPFINRTLHDYLSNTYVVEI